MSRGDPSHKLSFKPYTFSKTFTDLYAYSRGKDEQSFAKNTRITQKETVSLGWCTGYIYGLLPFLRENRKFCFENEIFFALLFEKLATQDGESHDGQCILSFPDDFFLLHQSS